MQYLCMTSPQICLFKCLAFLIGWLNDQQDSYRCPKALGRQLNAKVCGRVSPIFLSLFRPLRNTVITWKQLKCLSDSYIQNRTSSYIIIPNSLAWSIMQQYLEELTKTLVQYIVPDWAELQALVWLKFVNVICVWPFLFFFCRIVLSHSNWCSWLWAW